MMRRVAQTFWAHVTFVQTLGHVTLRGSQKWGLAKLETPNSSSRIREGHPTDRQHQPMDSLHCWQPSMATKDWVNGGAGKVTNLFMIGMWTATIPRGGTTPSFHHSLRPNMFPETQEHGKQLWTETQTQLQIMTGCSGFSDQPGQWQQRWYNKLWLIKWTL